jgi:hypothetical protein
MLVKEKCDLLMLCSDLAIKIEQLRSAILEQPADDKQPGKPSFYDLVLQQYATPKTRDRGASFDYNKFVELCRELGDRSKS